MKSNQYQPRFYRERASSKKLYQEQISVKETDLQIFTDKPLDKEFVKERVNLYRGQIEGYIARDRRFLTSLKPIAVELNAPQIIRDMARSAKKAQVGPMAAVAGAVAKFLGKDLLRQGFKDVIIENGGDIFLKTTKVLKVGVYAGDSKLSNKINLKIRPQDTPMGICTSSGTVGHSLSFGCADSVVILAKDASLADAVATAAGNRVNSREDLPKALNFARSVRGISGALIILGDNFVVGGKVELAN
jgi:ApbE superfamily uncharacterized protein (UPF0280 family)